MTTSASTSYRAIVLALAALALAACASSPRNAYVGRDARLVTASAVYDGDLKTISWYGPGFHGKLTASGERYDMDAMTCAHKTLPFGSMLKIVNPVNSREVKVIVNDRGPFVAGRELDVSRAAAERLGIIGSGTARVRVYSLGREKRYETYLAEDGSPSGRKGPFTIQVASLSEADNAEYLKSGLNLNYDNVYIMKKNINGKTFHRVRVGKFDDEDKARSYARKLAEEGYRDVRVYPYEM